MRFSILIPPSSLRFSKVVQWAAQHCTQICGLRMVIGVVANHAQVPSLGLTPTL